MIQPQASAQSFDRPGDHCPLCGGTSDRLFRKYSYWIHDCTQCHHRFVAMTPSPTHVKTVYGDDYFQGGGAGYPDYLAEADLLRQQGRRYAKLLSRHMPAGHLLDVGAAAGFILQGFADRGWQGSGIEPNPRMAAYARTQLGLPVEATTLEQLHSDAQFDLVTLIQVLPHFFDLNQALQVANDHTRPGGYWLIETWNCQSLTARFFRKNWHEYSPPSVLHWFSPPGLQQLMGKYGLQEVARGRPAKWINGAHAKSLLRYKLAELPFGQVMSRMLGVVPDRLAIPYPAEDLIWMLFQKQ